MASIDRLQNRDTDKQGNGPLKHREQRDAKVLAAFEGLVLGAAVAYMLLSANKVETPEIMEVPALIETDQATAGIYYDNFTGNYFDRSGHLISDLESVAGLHGIKVVDQGDLIFINGQLTPVYRVTPVN